MIEKIKKFFPLMPAKDDATKLIIAILVYFFVPGIIAGIIGFICGLSIILLPIAFVVGTVAFAYTVVGIVLAVLNYLGKEIK